MTNGEAIEHLEIVRARIIDDMQKFASKRSISDADKVANATARRLEMAAIDHAIRAMGGRPEQHVNR